MPYNFTPPPLLGTLQINDVGDTDGWSEGYYILNGDYELAYDILYGKIWQARRRLLSMEYKLVYARVSATNIRGDSFSQPLPDDFKENWNVFSGESGAAGSANNLVLWLKQITSVALVKAVRPLHGIPNSLLGSVPGTPDNDGREFRGSAKWDAAFKKYRDAIVGNCQLVHILGAGAGNITTVLGGAVNDLTTSIIVTDAKGFPTTGKFRIQIDSEEMLVIDKPDLPTPLPATPVSQTWRVRRAQNGTTAAAHVDLSTIRALEGDLVTKSGITDVSYPRRARYRKVGRPFGLLRGRTAPR